MPIRLSGMNSGLDTDSIVQALMASKTAKKTKIEHQKTQLEWKQNIWSELNTKIYSFYTNQVSKMRLQSGYVSKTATSSDTSKLTVTAGNNAANGSYKIKVKSLAASQYVTSAKLGANGDAKDINGEKITEKTKLSALGMKADGTNSIDVETKDGKSVSFTINENTTVKDFVDSMKGIGLTASYDEGQGRFFIGSPNSGSNQAFTIKMSAMESTQADKFAEVKEAVGYDTMSADIQKSVRESLQSISSDNSAENVATMLANIEAKSEEAVKETAQKYYSDKFSEQYEENYKSQYISVENDAINGVVKTVTADGEAALKESLGEEKYAKLSEDQKITELEKLAKTNAQKDIDALADQVVENGLTDAEAGINIADKASRTAAITNAVNAYAAVATTNRVTEEGSSTELQKLGLDTVDGSAVAEQSTGKGMVVIAASDTQVEVNGATLTSDSTTMSVNGLTLNLSGVTDDEVTVTVANDTSAVYDTIKDFINQYNSILTDLNGKYYASSAKDYAMLTDEQKEAMSEDEIEKWEDKIKDSLLRRDDTIGGLLTSMKESMTNVTITASNGKRYSLANLGIAMGSDYKERGLLHIRGDEDDKEYADKTNTLQNLLEEDPQIVQEVLSGIVGKLYSSMNEKMKSSTMSSAFTFYNDKQMTKQMTSYKSQIKDWEAKLAEYEEKYYRQFTAMEKAMAKINSTQSTFSSYMGIG